MSTSYVEKDDPRVLEAIRLFLPKNIGDRLTILDFRTPTHFYIYSFFNNIRAGSYSTIPADDLLGS